MAFEEKQAVTDRRCMLDQYNPFFLYAVM